MQAILHSTILGKGKPLLVLHGLFGMSDNWITLGRKFSESFEVHLIDLRNHGRSFHDGIMDFESMSEDLINYCNYYHLKSINLLGHSLGGKVAMFFAIQFPKMVHKLIVADIAPKRYSNRHQTIFNALDNVDFKRAKTRDEVGKILGKSISNQSIVQFLLKNVHHKTSDELDWRFNLGVLKKNYNVINEMLPAYGTFETETLFLKGENSDYILPSDESSIMAHFPIAQIEIISNAGHWLHAENPEEFYQKCLMFLNPS